MNSFLDLIRAVSQSTLCILDGDDNPDEITAKEIESDLKQHRFEAAQILSVLIAEPQLLRQLNVSAKAMNKELLPNIDPLSWWDTNRDERGR